MANPVLGKLQGQGLVETTTAGLEQAGAQLATTPVGAALQGRGKDSLKMAGTQPSKVNALATGMKDVGSVALGQLRETSQLMSGTAAEAEQTKRVQRASVLGRVDDQIAKIAQNKLLTKLKALTFEGAQIDQTKLPGYDKTKIETLTTSLSDLIKGGANLTDSDITTINDALAVVGEAPLDLDTTKPINTNILANKLSKLFTEKSKEELQGTISKAMLDARNESTIGALGEEVMPAIFNTKDAKQKDLVNLIASVLNLDPEKDAETIQKMKLSDLRSAIDSWKQTEFKDAATLRQTLNDPMASKAQRQLAVQELRRLGQVGVTAAEAKAGDLQKQMQEGDTIKLGTEEWSFDELFSDPTKLAQMQTWIDNPETAPPELKDWLAKNQDALALKVNELIGGGTGGLAGAVARVQANADTLKLDDAAKNIPAETLETFFPGWSKPGLDTRLPTAEEDAALAASILDTKQSKAAIEKAVADALAANPKLSEGEKEQIRAQARQRLLDSNPDYAKSLKYKVLQNPTTAANAALLMNNLRAIPGVDGKKVFSELTADQVRALATSENKVQDFLTGLRNRSSASNFKGDAATFGQEFKDTMRYLGLQDSAALLGNLADKDLAPFQKIFENAGLGSLIKGGKLNTEMLINQVKDLGKLSLTDLIAGRDRQIRDSLSRLTTSLLDEFGRMPSRFEKEPATYEERENLFVQEGNPKTSRQRLDELNAEEGRLGGENHQNWRAYEDIKIPEKPRRGSAPPDVYAEALANWESNTALIRQQKEQAYNKWKDSEARFWAVKNSRIDFENNRAQYDKDWQDKFNKWAENKRKTIDESNKKLSENYANLQKLLRGT